MLSCLVNIAQSNVPLAYNPFPKPTWVQHCLTASVMVGGDLELGQAIRAKMNAVVCLSDLSLSHPRIKAFELSYPALYMLFTYRVWHSNRTPD